MYSRKMLGALAAASLLMAGCAAPAAGSPDASTPASHNPSAEVSHASSPQASHTMPDGTVMSGAEHGAHQPGAQNPQGPSEAARMVCEGQVVDSVADVLGLDVELTPSSSWDEPMFTCTYEVDGGPLVLSVHDAADVATGEKHFAKLQQSFANAEEIKGMASLGMPSFSTGDGTVAFLRDGKTLLVDATALPGELGPNGSKSQHGAAYAIASAVLVCWVDHT